MTKARISLVVVAALAFAAIAYALIPSSREQLAGVVSIETTDA